MEHNLENCINHPKFQDELAKIAEELELDLTEVQKKGIACMQELFSEQHPIANMLSIKGFQLMMSKAYNNNIDIDAKQIKDLMKIMRQNSVAFILTHKTYLDTVVLVNTLVRYGMPIPYSFGGINLAFPGFKQLAKKSGIIFIRRSFKDDLIYKAALRHYISCLIENGDHLTWNIEGTRSRTGKIVYPQMGILKYIMEAEQESTRKIKYIPVSIVYDLIPDVKEMTEEGKGKEKKSEDIATFFSYIKKLGNEFGKAAIRFGEPVDASEHRNAMIPDFEEDSYAHQNTLPRFAFELIHEANMITPVTTVSLVCNILLNNFALTKREIEFNVIKLMNYIEQRKKDVLIERGKSISAAVQKALNLLKSAGIIQKNKAGFKTQYNLNSEEFLSATYYANMAAAHLYHRAFIEIALVKIKDIEASERIVSFWEEIMNLRNLFKFEFFYTNKPQFSSEIEAEMTLFDKNWRTILSNPEGNIEELLSKQELFVSKALLLTYLEANKVVCHTLETWDLEDEFNDDAFLELCLFKGKELHWQNSISRIDSVSKPFLISALRLAKNSKLTPIENKINSKSLTDWMNLLENLTERLRFLKKLEIINAKKSKNISSDEIVPGVNLENITEVVLEEEQGNHIAAFFDVDRTLINDFSAKQFLKSRLLSGQSSTKEILSQFAAILVYAAGNRDFETLTKIAALGIKSVKEQDFIELGEEVYQDYLMNTIYPEAKSLIESHQKKGHRVVIISAATRYQVLPIAKELGISDIFCTEMEVKKGKFTGEITEICWAEGKAKAGKKFAKKNAIDLSKSFFYTDSFDDFPLIKLVGKPIATNPDSRLSQVAFENNWPILRFKETTKKPLVNGLRTGLAAASIYPSALKGLLIGGLLFDIKEGRNTTLASIGDLGTKFAGLDIAIKGKHNLEDHRPAVFCFNHQSSADFFILLKILRKDIAGVAKKELEYTPLGPIFKALGAIFIDRADKLKAIEALKPAVEALKNGTSIVIAPEGTRSGSKKLGQFKKGAFHLAIKGGVPIVPIVIKNAYLAMPKGSNIFNPTAIEVVVLEPVDTSEWKPKNIDIYVEEVRNMFIKELEN
ncbi:MAG: HAD-IB family hydrolase [Flavobacteriia bacterium]|nr:HAD-IB family hydrolase [Flavobacteriia bacterium]OIP46750.1 MAG: acyltransferase [Flavobacteriaceae bacterium CG2_30_31_66]PIV95807.1 MAG: HAD-IB family hydrolase [Flavobacteriaceae bacterium CG17_big_fil_post_rev_8_21_14_2_50_31_13]PIX14831.1 MAG: HAD-IB family hydrolase [Flavobacteriaceae bacterium CG_4_8_14_3_um_filter_31_8]PIY16123.1 MAG: HAD-IB family hydrolase [Flavobacteriaceae bacterium CG_4_10_14_3_um_filter_31_253]PIZ11323.1 MAG: HAD-IB family hydrolase [Flavobacteriaceae bacteri